MTREHIEALKFNARSAMAKCELGPDHRNPENPDELVAYCGKCGWAPSLLKLAKELDAAESRLAALQGQLDEIADAIHPKRREKADYWTPSNLANLAAAHREDSLTLDECERPEHANTGYPSWDAEKACVMRREAFARLTAEHEALKRWVVELSQQTAPYLYDPAEGAMVPQRWALDVIAKSKALLEPASPPVPERTEPLKFICPKTKELCPMPMTCRHGCVAPERPQETQPPPTGGIGFEG